MDQKKTGAFIKSSGMKKNFTQEKLAEQFSVSRRTVSRWETGSNMPDLDVLIEMADFFDVDLRELLDGERRNGKMDKELKDTVLKVADYSNSEKKEDNQNCARVFCCRDNSFNSQCFIKFLRIAGDILGRLCKGFNLRIGFCRNGYGITIHKRIHGKAGFCQEAAF